MLALTLTLSSLCLLLPATSFADTRLSIENTDSGENAQMQAVLVTRGKVRMEQGGDDDTLLLYFQEGNTFYAIQPSDKSYMEFDPEEAGAMMDQASQMQQQMMAQLQERMKDLPAEQREQMMEMMKRSGQTMPGSPEEPVRYESRSGSDTVGGFSCSWVEAYQGAQKVRELCLADPGSMGMASADKDTMTAMQTSMMALAKRLGNAGMFQDNMPDGFPVHVRHFDASGRLTSEQRVQGVSTDTLDSSLFELPAGYQKRELPSFPQQ